MCYQTTGGHLCCRANLSDLTLFLYRPFHRPTAEGSVHSDFARLAKRADSSTANFFAGSRVRVHIDYTCTHHKTPDTAVYLVRESSHECQYAITSRVGFHVTQSAFPTPTNSIPMSPVSQASNGGPRTSSLTDSITDG